jgi:hypothetical protein
MQRTIIATLLAALSCSAFAADYFVVVPVKNKTVNVGAIQVSLAQGNLPAAVVGTAYAYDFKQNLQVSGDASYTGFGLKWSVASGTLPEGLTLNTSTGVVSGTPSVAGTSAFTLSAIYKTKSGTQSYQIASTLAVTVALAAGTPPEGNVGDAYSYNLNSLLTVTGDNTYNGSGATWSVVSSTLPAGLSLTADGRITGTPTSAGTGTVTAKAAYKGANGQQTYQVVVANLVVSLANSTLPGAVQGAAFNYDFKTKLTVTGDASYDSNAVTWSVSSGTLPAGLTLSSTGVLSGIAPSIADTGGTFSVTAGYKAKSATQAYTVFPGDPYWSQVAIMAHLDGNSVNSVGGAALTTSNLTYTSNSKFGSSAASFNGSSSAVYGPKLVIGTGDFTVEGWAYANALTNTKVLFSNGNGWANSSGYSWWLGTASGGDATRLEFGRYGVETFSASGVLPLNQWFHWALARQGGVVRAFVNGTQALTVNDSLNLSTPSTLANSVIGYHQSSFGWNGRIDEVRFTNGVARYTSNFTPAASAYPNQ